MSGEIEAAAERSAQWRTRCNNRTEDEHEYWENPALQAKDEAELVEWAVARLAADRADLEQRAKPIDPEWLESLGFAPDGVLDLGGTGRLTWRPSHGDVTLWGYPGTACSTRGRLLDLLRVLKGGAE